MEQAIALGKKSWDFVRERLNKIDFFDETKTELQKESPWYMLGGMYYLYWVVVIISGVILIALYLPTTEQAYDSIMVFSESILGLILRGLHKYGGDAMIIAATLRVYRMWFLAEYKNKGEFTFVLALILLVIAMYSGLSGYLLIWNQRAFWATKVFATFPTYLDIVPKDWYWPWEGAIIVNKNTWLIPNIIGMGTKLVGDYTHQGMSTSQILLGGSSIGQATMTRFFSLHFALSVILLIVTELYFYKNRLKRINLNRGVVFLLLGMLLATSILFPAESGSRANPEVTPLPILSDWYFLAMYQMLKYMDPYWATIWTVGLPFVGIALSFLDFGPEKSPWRRPIFTMIAIMALLQFIIFSILIIANQANIDRDPPYWYASMFFFITIGQFWHWALYKQKLPLLIWTGFTLVAALFYLWFWHWQAGPWFDIWYHVEILRDPAWISGEAIPTNHNDIGINYQEIRPEEGFSWTNLYWNYLWAAYAILQAVVTVFLLARHEREADRRLALEGAPA
jgi:quinol-cytochrome oxidoreductase complex cytochrome b subunit